MYVYTDRSQTRAIGGKPTRKAGTGAISIPMGINSSPLSEASRLDALEAPPRPREQGSRNVSRTRREGRETIALSWRIMAGTGSVWLGSRRGLRRRRGRRCWRWKMNFCCLPHLTLSCAPSDKLRRTTQHNCRGYIFLCRALERGYNCFSARWVPSPRPRAQSGVSKTRPASRSLAPIAPRARHNTCPIHRQRFGNGHTKMEY